MPPALEVHFPVLQELVDLVSLIPAEDLNPSPQLLLRLQQATDEIQRHVTEALEMQLINSGTAATFHATILSVRAYLAEHGISEAQA